MANIIFKYMDLPENAQKEVLRTMDHKDLFAFSTLSRKSKNLVVSLNIPAVSLSVYVCGSLIIMMRFPENTYLRLEFKLAKPNLQVLSLDGRYLQVSNGSYTTWSDPGFNFRELIVLLCSVFQFSSPSSLMLLSTDEIIKTETVWDNFSGILDNLGVLHENSEEFTQKILRLCLPTSKKLVLLRNSPLLGPIWFRQVAIQNVDILHLDHPIDLNDLLLCNLSIIGAVDNQITQKTINRFFRSWIKGSNRRLEYISFSLAEGEAADVNTLFKGINYKVIPETIERVVKKYVFENMTMFPEWKISRVVGGFEIRNKRGISATVLVRRVYRRLNILMFVWN